MRILRHMRAMNFMGAMNVMGAMNSMRTIARCARCDLFGSVVRCNMMKAGVGNGH
jgi:hypothetical protein